MLATRNGHEQCARTLIEAKAKIHAKSQDKESALDIARRRGCKHFVSCSKGLQALCELLEKEPPT